MTPSFSEAAAWRRAARALAKKGQVRAIYLRRLDKRGRNFGHLALTSVDSRLCGDAYPLHSPPWVDPSLGRLWESLGCRMQALVLEDVTGQPVAPCTASRIAREMREASEAAAQSRVERRPAFYHEQVLSLRSVAPDGYASAEEEGGDNS